MNKCPQNSLPINPLVLIEASVLAREHRGNKKRRYFAERNLQTVRAGETTVDFSIHIENRVSLRHFADLFHVKGLSPRSVKEEDSKTAGRDRGK